LENYIQPMTLEYSLAKTLPFINYSLTNKSIVRKGADNTVPVELNELKFLQQQYIDSADFIGQRLIKFLIQSYQDGKYPLYGSGYNNDIDDIQPSIDSPYEISGGLYLGTDYDEGSCDQVFNGRWRRSTNIE